MFFHCLSDKCLNVACPKTSQSEWNCFRQCFLFYKKEQFIRLKFSIKMFPKNSVRLILEFQLFFMFTFEVSKSIVK